MSAFPISSSVGYALMGMHNGWVVPKSAMRGGDIVIMGRNGNALDGAGANGHTAVVLKTPGSGPDVPLGWVLTMESWGHHGPGFKLRRVDDWDMVMRIPGMSPGRLRAMEILTQRCVEARIPYSAAGGNNDHDSIPDRGDLNDYNHPSTYIGVDCSGFVFALFDYAWSAYAGTAVMTPEQLAALIAYLQEVDVEHGPITGHDVDNERRAHLLNRNGQVHIAGSKSYSEKYAPKQDIMRDLRLERRDRPTNGTFTDLNGVVWRWTEQGGNFPPVVQQVKGEVIPTSVIPGFPDGT